LARNPDRSIFFIFSPVGSALKFVKITFSSVAEKKGICTRKIIIDEFRKFSYAKIPPAANLTFFFSRWQPSKKQSRMGFI